MDEVDIKIKWFPELKKYMVKVSVPFSTEFLTWAEKVNIDKPDRDYSNRVEKKDDHA